MKKKKILNLILNIIWRSCYFVYTVFAKTDKRDTKYYSSICAIFKDEAENLIEWIEFQKIIGFEHLYLYNNNSSDDYRKILEKYIKDGYVTLIDWPKKYDQMGAYRHCYENYRHETKWLALFDLDEFICPYYKDNINTWLQPYESFPAISFYWRMFGTSGFLKRNYNKLVIEQFTQAWSELDGIGKVIINTDTKYNIKNIYHHHLFSRISLFGFNIIIPMIDENKVFKFYPDIYEPPKKNTIQLNHYWSKSYDLYQNKTNRTDVANKNNELIKRKLDFFYSHELKNTKIDTKIWRFLIKLKLKMGRQ